MQPIDRPDGRHWCNPGSEEPSEASEVCPGCGAAWVLVEGVWTLSEVTDGV